MAALDEDSAVAPRQSASPAPAGNSTSRSEGSGSRKSGTGRKRLDLGNGPFEGGTSRGGTDLAALFVNAQRRNADKQRKTQAEKPKPAPKQKPSEPATPKQEARQQREIPRATTPATRTIHAALGVSRRRESPAPKRVYPPDRPPNPEFQRGPPPTSVAASTDDAEGAVDSTRPELSEGQGRPPPPPKRQLYQPGKQQQEIGPRPGSRATVATKQLFDPKAAGPPPGPSDTPPSTKPTAVKQDERSISPLPHASLSAPAAGSTYAADSLKQAYTHVQELETECLKESEQQRRQTEDGNFRRNKSGSASHLLEGFEDPNAYWIAQVQRHKELAEAHHNFLFMASDPQLPPGMRAMPHKHNTPLRLWQHAIHLLLERIRHAIADASDLTELLLEFVHYAYGFYGCLLEDHSLDDLQHVWLEQLGDLARYRMAVANILMRQQVSVSSSSPTLLSSQAVEMINETTPPKTRIDDEGAADWGEPASFGQAALEDIETDDVEIWKITALEWYSRALAEAPSCGRLHHHLALLHRQDDLKCLYHYCRSLVAAHPHHASNESILTLFGSEDQAKRIEPQADAISLFVHLQGLIFTRVSLDHFDEVLDRLIDALSKTKRPQASESADEKTDTLTFVRWIMMAAVTVASLLDFGKLESPLGAALRLHKPVEGAKRRPSKSVSNSRAPQTILLKSNAGNRHDRTRSDAETEDSADDSEEVSRPMQQLHLRNAETSVDEAAQSVPQACAQRLAFRLLRQAIQQHTADTSKTKTVNPFITVLITFLSRLFSSAFEQSFPLLEKQLPWQEIISLLNQMPKEIEARHDPPSRLPGQPLPEDWCLRGMDWVERGLYARGFWEARSNEERKGVISLLDSEFAVLESESEEHYISSLPTPTSTPEVVADLVTGRWKRLADAGSNFVRRVPGLSLDSEAPEGKRFKLSGAFSQKISAWRREDTFQGQKRRAQQASGSLGTSNIDEVLLTDESDNEQDEQDVLDLKAQRRSFRQLIRQSRGNSNRRPSLSAAEAKSGRALAPIQRRSDISAVAGYTVLVADATMLLKALPILEALLKCKRWTVVVPLAVVTDVDSKRDDASAAEAIAFLESHVKSHPLHLKIQTSKGNYLQDLRFRSEEFDEGQKQDTVTLVLRSAAWQKENFTNRMSLVNPTSTETITDKSLQVALLTLNQKFRQKARAQHVEALNDIEILDLTSPLPEE